MNLPKVSAPTVVQRIRSFIGQDAYELRYAATVSIWVRWACLAGALVESSYRVEYGALSHILNTLYLLAVMAVSGLVWLKIRSSGRVDPRWLLALSALDVACLALTLSMSRGVDSRYFPPVLLRGGGVRLVIHLALPGLLVDHHGGGDLRGGVPGGG